MSHRLSRPGALLAAPAALLALACAPPIAAAAEPPVVTGLDVRWVNALSLYTGVPMIVSGSGFTGTTEVVVGGATQTFEVVSDHTLKVNLRYAGAANAENPVQVRASGNLSAPNSAASFFIYGGPARSLTAAVPVTCNIGGGSSFAATLNTAFQSGHTGSSLSADTGAAVKPGPFRADLELAKRAAGTPDPLAALVGEAHVTSITAGVTGGGSPSTVNLGSAGYAFRTGSSVDGNPYQFAAALATDSVSLQMPSTMRTVGVDLHAYTASVTLDGGSSSTLSCTPQAGKGRVLSINTIAPAPTVTSVSPSTASTIGTTKVKVTGSGFVDGMPVTVGGASATSVSVLSPTQMEAVLPPRPAGAATIDVNYSSTQPDAAPPAINYVGSPPPAQRP